MATAVKPSEVLKPHLRVENLIKSSIEHLRTASHVAMDIDEEGGHALAQIVFVVGCELESWQKKHRKELES